jgi:hypothetical protein
MIKLFTSTFETSLLKNHEESLAEPGGTSQTKLKHAFSNDDPPSKKGRKLVI